MAIQRLRAKEKNIYFNAEFINIRDNRLNERNQIYSGSKQFSPFIYTDE